MPAFLPLALLVAAALAVPTTLLALTIRTPALGRSPATSAVLAAVAVAVAALAVAAMLGAGPVSATGVGCALGATVLAWRSVTRAWDVRGTVAWAVTVDAGVLYLAYVLVWSTTAQAGVLTTVASLALWLVEVFMFLIGLAYLWEMVDVLARRSWSVAAVPGGADGSARRPFVSLHVPAHNEPPDMVIATVEQLLRLEYDDYEVLLVDNNTTDPALWRPLEEFCARHDRVTFIHLENWPGYKSGALNHALTLTDPRAEVIGIVDADYRVDPSFLADCAPLFADPDVSFVQTPQDYRDWDVAPFFRRLYHSYGYFFDVSQRSRAERNGAIFGGTMGLIRRSALTDAGGWDEWCITEDAELSLRLLQAGGRGVHIDRSYGYGIMPLTFEALKGQRYRWCFGGIQILRLHWRSLLPGRRTPENQLTGAQRWAYLTGGLQWFGDLASLVFTGFLVLGALDAVAGDGLVIRRLSGLLLLAVLALVVLGAVRSLALLRRTSRASWGEAIGAFGLWLALGLTVARASWSGLVAKEGAFLRTPKVRGEPGMRDAVRGNVPETVLAVLCAAVALPALLHGATGAGAGAGAAVVGALLLVQGVGYAAAPANSLAAIRSELPDELRRRRREWLPSWTRVARPARRGAAVLAGAGAAFAAFVVLASPVAGPTILDLPGRVDQAEPRVEDLRAPSDGGSPASRTRPATPGGSSDGAGPGPVPSPDMSPDGEPAPVSTSDAVQPVTGPSSSGPVGDDGAAPTQASPSAPPATPPSAPSSPSSPAASPRGPQSGGASPTAPSQATQPTPGGKPTDKPGGGPTDKPGGRPTDDPGGNATAGP